MLSSRARWMCVAAFILSAVGSEDVPCSAESVESISPHRVLVQGMFEPSTGRGCDLLRRRFRRHVACVPRSRGKAAILSCGHQQSSHPASTSSQCHKNSRRGKCSQGRHSDDPPVRPGVHYRRTDRRAPFRGSIRGAASTIRSFMPPCPFGSHPHPLCTIGVHHSPRFMPGRK